MTIYRILIYNKSEPGPLEQRPEGVGTRRNSEAPALSWRDIMEEIISAISTVGFPISMALLMFWYLQKETENHRIETEGLKEAINDLKMAITTLINKLEVK